MDSTKISVIIPVHNEESFINESLLSVTESNLSEIEILVVDDGSNDNTYEECKKFTDEDSQYYDERVELYRKHNGGKSSAINYVSDEVNGQYVCIMDGDDKLPTNSLTTRYQAAIGADSPIVIGKYSFLENKDSIIAPGIPCCRNANVLINRLILGVRSPFHLNACLIKTSVFKKCGQFDVTLPRGQDKEFAVRLLKIVDDVYFVDSIVYLYRKHRSVSANKVKLRVLNAYTNIIILIRHKHPVYYLAVIWVGCLAIIKLLLEVLDVY